ncbi:hypothetical protein Btru_035380 [Bulinus truncatus]|nr:hypothetical protein Btru_035380 [Bulinus truncatus]
MFQKSLLYTLNGDSHSFDVSDTYAIQSASCFTNGEKFCLFYTAPIIYFGSQSIALLGDLSKWVPMSEQSVIKIWHSTFDITVAVRGRSGDTIKFSYILSGQRRHVSALVNDKGCALFIIDQSGNYTLKDEPKDFDCRFKPLPGTTPLPASSTPTQTTISRPTQTTAKGSSISVHTSTGIVRGGKWGHHAPGATHKGAPNVCCIIHTLYLLISFSKHTLARHCSLNAICYAVDMYHSKCFNKDKNI